VEYLIQLKNANKSQDAHLWKWFGSVLEYLGPDGMSSDESSMEDFETVHRVKNMPCRGLVMSQTTWTSLIASAIRMQKSLLLKGSSQQREFAGRQIHPVPATLSVDYHVHSMTMVGSTSWISTTSQNFNPLTRSSIGMISSSQCEQRRGVSS